MAWYGRAGAIQEKLARDHPESPEFASEWGGTLNNMAIIDLGERRFDEARAKVIVAIEWQRKALAGDPKHSRYRKYLGNHLRNLIRAADPLGRAAEADEARRELAELAVTDPSKAALDTRLTAVLGGQAPRDDAERLALANRAIEKALNAAAARLYAEALANSPKLGEDRQTQYRYNAACAATLAASGQGKDDPPPDHVAKARLRAQALDWLKAELSAWRRVAVTIAPGNKETVAKTLHHWKVDTDLAGIRDAKELAKLPEEERAAFQQLWSDVDGLLTKASSGK